MYMHKAATSSSAARKRAGSPERATREENDPIYHSNLSRAVRNIVGVSYDIDRKMPQDKSANTTPPLGVNNVKNIISRLTETKKSSITIDRKLELGRGGDAIIYDQKDGYIIKEFHNPVTDVAKQQQEVDMFNRAYGAESASILSKTMVRMRKIKGTPISETGVNSFAQIEGDALIESLASLHRKNIYHGDLHYSNILYDMESGEFNIIDYGTSRIESDAAILQREMDEFKMTTVYLWPAYIRNTAPSIIGTNGRIYI